MKSLLKLIIVSVLLISVTGEMLYARGNNKANGSAKDVTIGLSFSDFEVERWPVEAAALKEQFEAKGFKVLTQAANHNPKLQNDQIENLIVQGADLIIIVAEDGAAAATAVDRAVAEGVKVISYDRLIKSKNVDVYISFDNVEVGRTQARGVLNVKKSGKFLLLGGSPTDNNAILFRKGQMEVLQPLIDRKEIEIVGDQWVENWDPVLATQKMENMLTAAGNQVDAIVASNDGIALGALQAMKAQGLAGKVPISGQDATLAGTQSIIAGELTMTVFKDVRKLVPLAVSTAISLLQGDRIPNTKKLSLKELTGENIAGTIDCTFLSVVSVNADNIHKEIVLSKYQDYDEVYRDVPVKDRPSRNK